MWRITDDFWDRWELLLNMFERCRNWQEYVMDGSYPDCDMLPLGHLGKGFGDERVTRFTKAEQKTMMNLWCIFRSPLMLGAEMTKLDDYTLGLLTNANVLHLLEGSHGAREVYADDEVIVWTSKDNNGKDSYLAAFNISENDKEFNISELTKIDVSGTELWSEDIINTSKDLKLEAHGSILIKY